MERHVYFLEQSQEGEQLHRGVLATPTLAHLAMSYHEAVFKTSDARPFPLFFELVLPDGRKPIETSDDLRAVWAEAADESQALKFAVYRATNPGRKPMGRWYLPMRNAGALEYWLMERNVDMSAWGTPPAKSVVDLLNELRQGKVGMYTSLDDARPQREVHIVRVKLYSADRACILMQRRKAHKPLSLVATSLGQGESVYQAAMRTLRQKLKLVANVGRFELMGFEETVVEEEDSESYPGLCTRYLIETMLIRAPDLSADGDFATTSSNGKSSWNWTWVPVRVAELEMEKRRMQQSRDKAARAAALALEQEQARQGIAPSASHSPYTSPLTPLTGGSVRRALNSHRSRAMMVMSMSLRSTTRDGTGTGTGTDTGTGTGTGTAGAAGASAGDDPAKGGGKSASSGDDLRGGPSTLEGLQSLETVREWLETRGINTSGYGRGQAKPLEKLVKELAEGESVLIMDPAQQAMPFRVTSVAKVRVRAERPDEPGTLSSTGTGSGADTQSTGKEEDDGARTASSATEATEAEELLRTTSTGGMPGRTSSSGSTGSALGAATRLTKSGPLDGSGHGSPQQQMLEPLGDIRRRSTLGNQLFLVETHQHIRKKDSLQIRLRYIMLSEKVKVGEYSWETAVRGLHEELHAASGLRLSEPRLLDAEAPLVEWVTSPSYPGLLTKYVLHSFDVAVDGLPQQPFLTTEGPCTHFWDWWTLKELKDTKGNLTLQVDKYLSFNEQFNQGADPTDSVQALLDFAKKATKSNDGAALRHCLNTMEDRWNRFLSVAERQSLLDLATKQQSKAALESLVLAHLPLAQPHEVGTMLYYAARVDHALLVQRLIDEGAPPVFACLHCAVEQMHTHVLAVLLPLWRPVVRTDVAAGEVPRPCKHEVFQWTTRQQLDSLLHVVDRSRDLAPPVFAMSRRAQSKQYVELMSLLLRQCYLPESHQGDDALAEGARSFLRELASLSPGRRRAALVDFAQNTVSPFSNIVALVGHARDLARADPWIAHEADQMASLLACMFGGLLDACLDESEAFALISDFHLSSAPATATRLLVRTGAEQLVTHQVGAWYELLWRGELPSEPLPRLFRQRSASVAPRPVAGALLSLAYSAVAWVPCVGAPPAAVTPAAKAGALVLSHVLYVLAFVVTALYGDDDQPALRLMVSGLGVAQALADAERAYALRRAEHVVLPPDALCLLHAGTAAVALVQQLVWDHRQTGYVLSAAAFALALMRLLQLLFLHPRLQAPLLSWRATCTVVAPHVAVLLLCGSAAVVFGALLEHDVDTVSAWVANTVGVVPEDGDWEHAAHSEFVHDTLNTVRVVCSILAAVVLAHLFVSVQRVTGAARRSHLERAAAISNCAVMPAVVAPFNVLRVFHSLRAAVSHTEVHHARSGGPQLHGSIINDVAASVNAIRARIVASYFAAPPAQVPADSMSRDHGGGGGGGGGAWPSVRVPL